MHSILEILDEPTDGAGPDLITLEDLKFALQITGTSEDAALAAAITMQSQIIAEYCDRRFGRADVLETFTFDPGENLPLRQGLTLSLYPVAQIADVSCVGVTAADFNFDPDSGRLWIGTNYWPNYWPGGPGWGWYSAGNVAVTYSGGYDLPDQSPARLQRAVIELVAMVRTQSGAGARDPTIRELQHGDTRVSYVSPSFASGAVTAGQHLSPSVADLIKPYRRMYVA